MEALNAYQLANLADCGTPESSGIFFNTSTKAYESETPSPGAAFLLRVQTMVTEYINYSSTDGMDTSDQAHEIADSAVPIYTHELWATFVDLAAYNEDPSDLGYSFDANQLMEDAAKTCLYMIAERLALALLESATTDEEV